MKFRREFSPKQYLTDSFFGKKLAKNFNDEIFGEKILVRKNLGEKKFDDANFGEKILWHDKFLARKILVPKFLSPKKLSLAKQCLAAGTNVQPWGAGWAGGKYAPGVLGCIVAGVMSLDKGARD